MKLTTKKFVVTVVVDADEVQGSNLQRLRADVESRAGDFTGVYFASVDPISHTARVVEAPEPPDADDDLGAFDRWEKQYVLPLA